MLWRREQRGEKLTKVPYRARDGFPANVTNPNDWTTFDHIMAELQTRGGEHGWHGCGFALGGGFAGADFDHCDDPAKWAVQEQYLRSLETYTERSPSGTGYHALFKAHLGRGRRWTDMGIEVYGEGRFFTMTGDVVWDLPLNERQSQADAMLLSFPNKSTHELPTATSQPQSEDDQTVYNRAQIAFNGDKFKALWNGDFTEWYTSQSEADYALIDIIGFYTQNYEQIARMFRASALGKRDKANRDDYVNPMVQMSQDKRLEKEATEDDYAVAEAGARMWQTGKAKQSEAAPEPAPAPVPAPAPSPPPPPPGDDGEAEFDDSGQDWPPGLVGALAQHLYLTSARPVKALAIASAVFMWAGIVGRQYNISGNQGLNLYGVIVGRSGIGKDVLHDGLDTFMAHIMNGGPGRGAIQGVMQFRGPADLGSGSGLNRALQKNPCCLIMAGEIGMRLKLLASPKAPASEKQLEKNLLAVYSKSGKHSVYMPTAYSDIAKGGEPISAPALTLCGETTAENFFSALTEEMISSGLLSRFIIIEYKGKRPYLNYENLMRPWNEDFLKAAASLVYKMIENQKANFVHQIIIAPEADKWSREMDREFTDKYNAVQNNEAGTLYNRVHLNVLKVAGIIAVGMNPENPIVTMDVLRWAYEWVSTGTKNVMRRFERDEVGEDDTEHRQLARLKEQVCRYMEADKPTLDRYDCNPAMRDAGIVPLAFLQRSLYAVAGFRKDRLGPKTAINRAVQVLIEQGSIRKVPDKDMAEKFKSSQIAYLILRPHNFRED